MTRRLIAWAASLALLGCLAVAAVGTVRWPLISDAVLMHYVVLLLGHGMAPYRDIVDVNMPGSYLVDLGVTKLFGTGPVGWRLFDYALMAAAAAAIAATVPPRASLAGVLGAALFSLTHMADGVAQAGQRDFVVAVLLLVGFAVLARGLVRDLAPDLTPDLSRALTPSLLPSERDDQSRAQVRTEAPRAGPRRAGWRFFVFGLCCGGAATIKPPALLFALLLPAALSRGGGRAAPRCLAAGAAGLLLPCLGAVAWLQSIGSLPAFLHTASGLVVYHAGMARHGVRFLLLHAVPSQLLPLAALAAAMIVAARSWRNRQLQLVLLAIGCGLIFYCTQGKAYPYHRYPLLGFLWVFVAGEIAQALTAAPVSGRARVQAVLAWAAVAYCVLWLAPASAARALRYDWRSQPSLDALQADLTRMGGSTLDRRVQCIDTMAGCITVLDRMRLVQFTGFLYDCYFFAPGASPVKEAQRRDFLAQILKKPPAVFVVTDQWCLDLPSGYTKLDQWPAFASYLEAHYRLAAERAWPGGGSRRHLATLHFGYRIYVRDPM